MRLYDISVPLSPALPFYPGDPVMSVREHSQISQGKGANVSELTFGSHTGTHLDPPRHFYDTLPSVDELPLSRFYGPALVLDLRGREQISAADLADIPMEPGLNLLLHTDNSGALYQPAFREDYVYLTGDAARLLRDRKINLIGIDYLSVEQFHGDGSCPAHKTLLGAEILILEGLDLTDVPAGRYTLCAFPLNLPGGNGSPVRAVLIDHEEREHV